MNSVSGLEGRLMEEIRDRSMLFFGSRDVERFLDISKSYVYRLLSRMVEKDLIVRVENGRYVLKEYYESRDVYELASNVLRNSYLGFLSALHFHGLINQVPSTVLVASTSRKRGFKIQGREIVFCLVGKGDFFGYSRFGNTVVSDKEKTIVDLLKYPSKTGSMSRVFESLDGSFDTGKLVEYCVKTDSSAAASRLGYMMDRKDMDFDEEILEESISHYSRLDPSNERVNPSSKWKLYVNGDLG